jgi:ParB-like chromosome segregation protein Spo0J
MKRSLTAYGQRKPIVVNSTTGIIEAGNGLWTAAKSLGWDSIAAVMVEDDPESATGFAIMDNRSAELAEWDMPVLKDLLEELDNGAVDMSLTGFDEKELEKLMTAAPQEKANNAKPITCPECGHEFTLGVD